MINFNIRGIYSFNVFPSALLNTSFNNVTIMGIMDPESASKEIDIVALHAQVYPSLPVGSPNNPKAYDYVKIKTTTGQVTILGLAWIDPASVAQVSSSTITAVIGGVSAGDVTRIRNMFAQNGYNNVNISIN